MSTTHSHLLTLGYIFLRHTVAQYMRKVIECTNTNNVYGPFHDVHHFCSVVT